LDDGDVDQPRNVDQSLITWRIKNIAIAYKDDVPKGVFGTAVNGKGLDDIEKYC